MNTFPVISYPFSPTYREPINVGVLAYMRERHRGRIYSAVIDEFEKSGISRADLARRLQKGNDQISRWLGSPGNWTLDTISDLFFAISGGEPVYHVRYPLHLLAANEIETYWNASFPYWGAVPHNSSYTGEPLSYAETARINPQVVTAVAQIAVIDNGGSNASVGPPASVTTGSGLYYGVTYYGDNSSSVTATTGGNRSIQASGYVENVAVAASFGGSLPAGSNWVSALNVGTYAR
jgi:hypothetical protein